MPRLFFALALLASGCSLAGPSDADIEAARSPEAEGALVNRSSSDVVAMALHADVAAVINIATEFEVTDRSGVIERGEAAPLAVSGYQEGDGFLIYLFRVRGSRATYAGPLTVDADDFERNDRVVTVRRF